MDCVFYEVRLFRYESSTGTRLLVVGANKKQFTQSFFK